MSPDWKPRCQFLNPYLRWCIYPAGTEKQKSYLLFLDVSNFVFKAYESIINIGLICLGRRGSRTKSRLQGAHGSLAFPMLIVVQLRLGWLHIPLSPLLWRVWRWLVTQRWRELHHWNGWGWRREGAKKVKYKNKLGLKGHIQALMSLKSLDPLPQSSLSQKWAQNPTVF